MEFQLRGIFPREASGWTFQDKLFAATEIPLQAPVSSCTERLPARAVQNGQLKQVKGTAH